MNDLPKYKHEGEVYLYIFSHILFIRINTVVRGICLSMSSAGVTTALEVLFFIGAFTSPKGKEKGGVSTNTEKDSK